MMFRNVLLVWLLKIFRWWFDSGGSALFASSSFTRLRQVQLVGRKIEVNAHECLDYDYVLYS